MKNKIQDGSVIDYTNGTGSDIASGDVVVIGGGSTAMIGVAMVDIADGETGSVALEGVYEVPKVTAAVIAQGEAVIYDVSVSKFDDDQATPATGDVSGAATAFAAAGNGATVVQIKLHGRAGTVTA